MAGKVIVQQPLVMRRRSWRRLYVPFLFLLPAFLLLIVFRYIPAVSAVYHSFTDWSLTSENFVGLKQYQTMFSDPLFARSVRNIFVYTIGRTIIAIVMAIFGAELVYNLKSQSTKSFWRIVFTLPIIIPISVTLLAWQHVYAGQLGLINQVLIALGAEQFTQAWLGQPTTALQALMFIGFPFISTLNFLVLLSALESLPAEINDAALIDGATRPTRIMFIDIPSIRGAFALAIVLELSKNLQEFNAMLVLTRGGPANSTLSPGFYLYQQAFNYGHYGYATSIGTVLMLMVLILSMVILWYRYRRAHDVDI